MGGIAEEPGATDIIVFLPGNWNFRFLLPTVNQTRNIRSTRSRAVSFLIRYADI